MEGVLGGTANAGSQGSAHGTHYGAPGDGLAILAQVEASEDPNNLGADLMFKEYSLREAVIILLPDRLRSVLKVPVPRRLWPEASLCISKPWPARLIRLRSRLDRLLSAIRRRAAHLRRMG